MKILLISANTEMINMPVLPMGLACVAASARNAGHEVKLLNLMTRQDTGALIQTAIAESLPDLIGISVRNIDDQIRDQPRFLLDPVKTVVAQCRSHSSAKIVLGGAGFSIFPETALSYLGADMGIRGEGEQAFVTLLHRLERSETIDDIPGLCLPNQKCNPPVFPKHLNDYPLPTPENLSLPDDLKREEIWIPFQTRRGCAMDCSYCSTSAIEGRVLRKLSPKLAVDLIRLYVEAGFDKFFFTDNTFNFPYSYAEALCDEIIASGLKIRWRCIFYPWKADQHLIRKMADAGCRELSMGFESGDNTVLKRLNKKFTTEEVRQISQILGEFGISRMGFLLLGGPGETRQSVEKSLEYAESLNTEALKITCGIRIYPHTALSAIARNEDMIAADDDLMQPVFYMADGLDGWIQEFVKERAKDHRNWITNFKD